MPTALATSTATTQTMIICVPQEIPSTALTSRQLDRHFGVTGSTSRRFWAGPKLRMWQKSHLIDPHKGSPVACAGGPVRLLDLTGVAHAAGIGAGLRFQRYAQLAAGTKPAIPWADMLARHHADPERFPMTRAKAAFEAQPRVQAILLHNAASYTPHDRIDLAELGALQAGHIAYQHYKAMSQICGDALLTERGQQLQPASDTVADRARYLEQARAYLDNLDPDTRLLAIAL
ncbi:hypothetical protein ACLQ24_00250 [Micromonospora sp. DT4]|uniref:hypothetical protein n=1 Tax=Micromonospora sp. DT4 TaxID=3393438 RepID=UPI003CF6DFD9